MFVHDGTSLFRGCSRSEDGWHIQDTDSNRLRMAQYLAEVLEAAMATQWDPRWMRANSVMVEALAQCQSPMTRGEGGDFAPPQEREDVLMVDSSAAYAPVVEQEDEAEDEEQDEEPVTRECGIPARKPKAIPPLWRPRAKDPDKLLLHGSDFAGMARFARQLAFFLFFLRWGTPGLGSSLPQSGGKVQGRSSA